MVGWFSSPHRPRIVPWNVSSSTSSSCPTWRRCRTTSTLRRTRRCGDSAAAWRSPWEGRWSWWVPANWKDAWMKVEWNDRNEVWGIFIVWVDMDEISVAVLFFWCAWIWIFSWWNFSYVFFWMCLDLYLQLRLDFFGSFQRECVLATWSWWGLS